MALSEKEVEQIREIVKNGNGKSYMWVWQALSSLIVILTGLFLYYGGFVELKTTVSYLATDFKELKVDVKTHMSDKTIHQFRPERRGDK